MVMYAFVCKLVLLFVGAHETCSARLAFALTVLSVFFSVQVEESLPSFAPFGARIEDFRSYLNVYFCFLERWMYPVTPENLSKLFREGEQGSSVTYVGHGLYQVRRKNICGD